METSESQLALARLSSVISDNGAEVQFGQDGPASSTASTKIAIHSPNDTQPDENVAVKTFCNRRRCSCVLVTLLLFVVLVVMSVALALTSKQSGVPACVSLCNSTANESSAFPMTDVERENSTVSMNMTGYIWEESRLPFSVIPTFYQILLNIDISSRRFAGKVEIEILCQQTTNLLILHAHQINIENTVAMVMDLHTGANLTIIDRFQYALYQYDVIVLQEQLETNSRYLLTISNFSALLSENYENFAGGFGLYLSSYESPTNGTRYLAASFLSPVSARKVFPCFDEPSFKANFSITLIHEAKYIALSNMPEKLSPYGKEKRQDGLIATHFETTPKMSTYLLAFIVCDFAHRATVSNHGRVEFRVWARKGAMDQVAYALDIGPKIFTYLENYASIPYSLPKMDMIALPSLVATGMENWGLNTFRENVLLYKEELSSSRDKQWIALLIGHELSHQWHSNLVTQAWWDELWLKEGFATFMGLKAVDYVHPDYQMIAQQFLCDDLHNVFLLDSLSTSHPVNQHVDTPSEILDNFDMIAYQKGSALVRMMYFFLGEETFTQGLFKYLNDNAYGSATSQDLWVAMDWAAKKNDLPVDVPTVMDRWLLQMGYPLVTITRDYRNKRATISQRHFLIDKGINGTVRESPYDYSWHIPVTYTYGGKERFSDAFQTWLITEKKIVDLSSVDNDEWVVANVNQTYYYRVNYDMDNWNLIIDQLKTNHEDISVSQRAALIDDAFNLAKSGELSQIIGFRLTEYLRNETEYLPWRTAMRVLGHIDQLLGHTVAYGVFQKYMLKQVEWLYEKVGWNDTGLQLERYHRITILGVACRYGHAGCIQKASDLYADWMEGRISIAPNLQKIVICGGIAAGGLEEWDYAWQMYKESNVASEKLMFLEALACSGELWILSRYLERTLDTNEIPLMLALDVYKSVSSNHLGSYLMWDFFREKWSIIVNRYAGGLFQIAPLVESITSSFDTETKLQELQLFIDTHVTKKEDIDSGVFAGGSSFLSAIDKTKANINWLKSNQSPVREWLLEASRDGYKLAKFAGMIADLE